jgi:hypothetical protein
MAVGLRRELGLVLSWLIFPIVPVLLEDLYYQICNFEPFGVRQTGPDPHDWGWVMWVIVLGPLLGYGFLAGATLGLPNDLEPSRGVLRRFLRRRGVWVAVGPWTGLLFWVGVYFGTVFVLWVLEIASAPLNRLVPPERRPDLRPPQWWYETWAYWALSWVLTIVPLGILAYGWLWPAHAALRRASQIGVWGRALYRGVVAALMFVGSLFGSFWAITWAWRSYFFDPRVMSMVVVALGVAVLSGCSSTMITYGEMRRRELFHAMLVAWVLGLALMWRWWSRRRRGPP